MNDNDKYNNEMILSLRYCTSDDVKNMLTGQNHKKDDAGEIVVKKYINED